MEVFSKERVLELKARGLRRRDIAPLFGLSPSALDRRMNPPKPRVRRPRDFSSTHTRGPARPSLSQEELVARHARHVQWATLEAKRDLTATFFGDPFPGRRELLAGLDPKSAKE